MKYRPDGLPSAIELSKKYNLYGITKEVACQLMVELAYDAMLDALRENYMGTDFAKAKLYFIRNLTEQEVRTKLYHVKTKTVKHKKTILKKKVDSEKKTHESLPAKSR